MKLALLFLPLLGLASSAFAADSIGKFQVNTMLRLNLCAVKAETDTNCYDYDPSIDSQVNDTLVLTPETENRASVTKAYHLVGPYNLTADVVLSVSISRLPPDLVDDKNFTLDAHLLPVGVAPEFAVQEHMISLTAADLSQFLTLYGSGPTTMHTMANAAKVALLPVFSLSKIQPLK